MKRLALTGILPAFFVAASVNCRGQSNVYSLNICEPCFVDVRTIIDHHWVIQFTSAGNWGVEQYHYGNLFPAGPNTWVYAGAHVYGYSQPIWHLALQTLLAVLAAVGVIWAGMFALARYLRSRGEFLPQADETG